MRFAHARDIKHLVDIQLDLPGPYCIHDLLPRRRRQVDRARPKHSQMLSVNRECLLKLKVKIPPTFLGNKQNGSNSDLHTLDNEPTAAMTPSGARAAHESSRTGGPTSSTAFVAPTPPVSLLTSALTDPVSRMTWSAPLAWTAPIFRSDRVVEMTVEALNRLDLARVAQASPTLLVPPRMRRVSVGLSLSAFCNVPQASER